MSLNFCGAVWEPVSDLHPIVTGVSRAGFWDTKTLEFIKGEGEEHMALAAGMLSAQSHQLLVTQRTHLCGFLSLREVIIYSCIWMASFKRQTTRDGTRGFNLLLHLYWHLCPLLLLFLLLPSSQLLKVSTATGEKSGWDGRSCFASFPGCCWCYSSFCSCLGVRFPKKVWANRAVPCCQKGMVLIPGPSQSSCMH